MNAFVIIIFIKCKFTGFLSIEQTKTYQNNGKQKKKSIVNQIICYQNYIV